MTARRLYLDNAATSHPKPPGVQEAMVRYATMIAASPGRGAYEETRTADAIVDRCRQRIRTLMNAPTDSHIIFTLNCTDALNLAIKGIVNTHLHRGESVHVIATDMDHNSILRPVNALAERPAPFGIERTFIPCDPNSGAVDPEDIFDAIRDDTRLICLTHASNVSGTVQPLEQIARGCVQRGVPLLVDAAQSLGHLPIDVTAMDIDFLAFPGHKGLLGPLGTGGLYIKPGLDTRLEPLREGGTGSRSELDTQPLELPDRFEPGSPNAIGLAGLAEGVAWILEQGAAKIAHHERTLLQVLLPALRAIDGVQVIGPTADTPAHRCGVVSFTIDGMNPHEVAAQLEAQGVLTRAGLHCAPRAHETFGTTANDGTTRLSLGPFIETPDIRRVIEAVQRVAATEAITV